MAKQVEKPEIFIRDAGPSRPGIKELVVFYDKDRLAERGLHTEYAASFSPEPGVAVSVVKLLFEYVCEHRLGFREFDLIKVLDNG